VNYGESIETLSSLVLNESTSTRLYVMQKPDKLVDFDTALTP